MNSRERFLEVMNFNTDVRTLKREFGFWGENINQWYEEGLLEKFGTNIPTADHRQCPVYTPVDARLAQEPHLPRKVLRRARAAHPPAEGHRHLGRRAVLAEPGLPVGPRRDGPLWLRQEHRTGSGRAGLLSDVRPQVLAEDEQYVDYVDIDGVKRRFQKEEGSSHPLRTGRSPMGELAGVEADAAAAGQHSRPLPGQLARRVEEYKTRDYPLAIGGYPCGFFGTLVHLMGYENVFLKYYDAPDLVTDVLNHFTDLWIAIWEEFLKDVTPDCCHIWEDMSSTKGPLISKKIFTRFMAPCYLRGPTSSRAGASTSSSWTPTATASPSSRGSSTSA